jgi:hypothetical protein
MDRDLIRADAALQAQIDNLSTTKRRVPIVASYATDAGQVIAHNTETVIDFEEVVRDTHSAVTVGAAWKFTAPVAADYVVSVAILMGATNQWAAGESADLRLWKNGALFRGLDRKDNFSGATAQYMQLSGTSTIYLSAGEYIDVRLIQMSGISLGLFASVVNNWISIYRI